MDRRPTIMLRARHTYTRRVPCPWLANARRTRIYSRPLHPFTVAIYIRQPCCVVAAAAAAAVFLLLHQYTATRDVNKYGRLLN